MKRIISLLLFMTLTIGSAHGATPTTATTKAAPVTRADFEKAAMRQGYRLIRDSRLKATDESFELWQRGGVDIFVTFSGDTVKKVSVSVLE